VIPEADNCLYVPGGRDGRDGVTLTLAVQQRVKIAAEQRAVGVG
jgi:hypothetical protein